MPAGKTLTVTDFFGSEGSNKGSRIDVYARPYGGAWYNPIGTELDNAFASLNISVPVTFGAKTDIEFRATGLQAAAFVTAGLFGYYEDE